MAARNKPAGIRPLVYGMDKSKGGIEGLSVSGCLDQVERERLFGRFLAITDSQGLIDAHGLVADCGD